MDSSNDSDAKSSHTEDISRGDADSSLGSSRPRRLVFRSKARNQEAKRSSDSENESDYSENGDRSGNYNAPRSDLGVNYQTDFPTKNRSFPLREKVVGYDALRRPNCFIHDTICDLCYQFIESSLCKRSWKFPNSRWRWKDFANGIDYRPSFRHYQSSRALRASAGAGCELCQVMLRSTAFTEGEELTLVGKSGPAFGKLVRKKYGKGANDWSAFTIRPLNGFGDDLQRTDEDFEFILAKNEEDCCQLSTRSSDATLLYPSPSPASGASFDQMHKWYRVCSKSHEKCMPLHRFLPTRLLDVSLSDPSSDRIRLVDTAYTLKDSDHVKYVALSYCWGESQNPETKRDNIHDHYDGLELASLPPTIRDAVNVTRRLGFNYLWVDALCICQDDQEEWEREAERMSDVYGGSELTISAMSSSDTSQGFLQDRRLRGIPIGEVTVSYGTWQDSLQLFIRREPRHLRQEFWYSPLNKRAWPLQERILSPRVLHFCRDQLIWECNTDHLKSETGETEDWGGIVIRLSDMLGAPHAFGPRDLWDCIVDEYAGRQLRNSGDRLRAISSLASRLRADGTKDGRYVAGLWEGDLDFQLMWSSSKETDTHYGQSVQPNTAYPTWSWAYWNLEVSTVSRGGLTSVLARPPHFSFRTPEEQVQSARGGPTVPFAEVKLRGYIQSVGDTAIRVESQPGRHFITKTREYRGLPGDDSTWRFDHEPINTVPHFCLRVLEASTTGQEPFKFKTRIYYLVLEKVDSFEEARQHVYKRIGMLKLYSMPKINFKAPYPDVLFKNGKPLLTNGSWEDIILV